MPLYIIVLWLEHIQNFIFFIKFQSNFHTFFDASFWDSFFKILVRPGTKKLDFVSPLAPSWVPNGSQNRSKGAQNRPSGTKMRPFSQRWVALFGASFFLWFFGATWCQKGGFWEPLGAQLGPKWRPKSPKWRQKCAKKYQDPPKKYQHPPKSIGLIFLVRLGAKKVDFGSPLAPSWAPNGAQNRAKGAQNRPSGAKKQRAHKSRWHFFAIVFFFDFFGATWCQKGRFWEPLGAQLVPKWRPKSPKWCRKVTQVVPKRVPKV